MTVEVGPRKAGSVLRKRVLGVPVIYLAAGFVVIIAIYAWKAKASAPAETGQADNVGPDAEDADNGVGTLVGTSGGTSYVDGSGTATVPDGTVVATNTTVPSSSNSSITDNSAWMSAGVQFLISKGYGAGDAQSALQTYLAGNDMTYDQGVMRDIVIKEYGLPPDGAQIGNTAPKPVSNTYTSYILNPVTGEVFGVKADGSRVYLDAKTYAALGKPKTTTLDAKSMYKAYVEDPRSHAIYGITYSNQYVWLSNAAWKSLGAPKPSRMLTATEQKHLR